MNGLQVLLCLQARTSMHSFGWKLDYGTPANDMNSTIAAFLQAFVRAISREPLPNTPPHTIIFEYGLGDAQVSWLGCQTIARSAGSSMFASNVREGNETLSGFPFVSDTTVLSGVGNNLIQVSKRLGRVSVDSQSATSLATLPMPPLFPLTLPPKFTITTPALHFRVGTLEYRRPLSSTFPPTLPRTHMSALGAQPRPKLKWHAFSQQEKSTTLAPAPAISLPLPTNICKLASLSISLTAGGGEPTWFSSNSVTMVPVLLPGVCRLMLHTSRANEQPVNVQIVLF